MSRRKSTYSYAKVEGQYEAFCPFCSHSISNSRTESYDAIKNNKEQTILKYIRICSNCNNEYLIYKTMPTINSSGIFLKKEDVHEKAENN